MAGSVILENTEVRKGAQVKDAFVCERCRIGAHSLVTGGSVLGAGSVTLASSVSQGGKKYPPGSVLARSPVFAEEGLVFTEEGAGQGGTPGLDADGARKLGFALGKYFSGGVGILWDDREKNSSFYAATLSSGIVKSGQKALFLFAGIREMASFAAAALSMPVVFVSEREGKGIFFVYGKDSMPLTRGQVLKLSRYFEEEEMISGGEIYSRKDIPLLYESSLSDKMGRGENISVCFYGPFSDILRRAAIKNGYNAYNGTRKDGLCMEVFSGEVKVFFRGERLSDTEKTRLFVLDRQMKQGRMYFCLPADVPYYFAKHIEENGGKAEYFTLGHTAKEETKERSYAKRDRFLYDSVFLAAEVLRLRREMGEEAFLKALKEVPEIYVSTLLYHPDKENKARLLGALGPDFGKRGRVRVESGFFGLKIISEALSFEAALDNAYEYRGKINEIEEKIRGK